MNEMAKGGEISMKNNTIITIILVIVVGAAGFFAGTKYQQSQAGSARQFAQGTGGFGGRAGGTGGRTGMRPVNGQILSSDNKSITVKLQDGSSSIVLLTDKTTINKADQATVSDLTVGARVAVFGQTNADGSVTAQSVQLNPIMRGGGTATPAATSPSPASSY